MAKNNKQKRIYQGGSKVKTMAGTFQVPDIALKMPEIFLLDLRKFQQAILSAKQIDYASRVQLYDIYESHEIDIHLMGTLDKRLRGVTQMPIEFHVNGKADEVITPQIRSPWFKEAMKDIVMSSFWGFSLLQFYLDEEGNIKADSINRKHYDPVNRELKREQNDLSGEPIENFPNMLFIGTERKLGIFLDLMIAVLYKRGNVSDWARFCNVFGIPIRKYTYDAGDDEARLRLIKDAQQQGSSAVYICPKDSDLEFIEPRNAWGTGEIFKQFTEYWDSKISIRILGNTLTTDAKSTGTQALGEVHKEVEDEMNKDDRSLILDVLNYHMKAIFANLGFKTDGGEFVYARKEKTHPTQQVDIVLKLNSIGLPISDDYMYEFSGIPKPDNYNELITKREAEKEAMRRQLEGAGDVQVEESEQDDEGKKKDDKTKGNNPPKANNLKNRLRSFFGLAPTSTIVLGADNDF